MKISDVTIEEIIELHNAQCERANQIAEEQGFDLTTPEGKEAIVEFMGDALDPVIVKQFVLSSPALIQAVAEMDFLTVGRAFFRAGFMSGRKSAEEVVDAA